MIETVVTNVSLYVCEECHHEWKSLRPKPPLRCPKCRSRTWRGKLKLGRRPKPKRDGRFVPRLTKQVPLTIPKPMRKPL